MWLNLEHPKILKQTTQEFFDCHKCYERMEFVFYSRKDVPPDKNKIVTWLEMKRLS